jgi:DNA-binding MarR family transcriptional regulator
VQRISSVRKLRAIEFSSELFGEPGWDMLLELYMREESGMSVGFEDLQEAANIPSSVTSRWVKVLQNEGLITRGRRLIKDEKALFELSTQGREKLERYLDTVKSHVTHVPT